MNEERMKEALKEAVETAHSCLMCRNKPKYAAVWLPPEDEKTQWILNAPEGKYRMIVYTLCHKCHRNRDLDKIENKLKSEALLDLNPKIYS